MLKRQNPDLPWEEVMKSSESFLGSLNLSLIAPISIGNQLVGLIGLGPEFTGGKYGHDDFDLLAALGSQTAAALLAVRMAEELAHTGNSRPGIDYRLLSSTILRMPPPCSLCCKKMLRNISMSLNFSRICWNWSTML